MAGSEQPFLGAERRKEISKGFYGAVGAVIVTLGINAFTMYNQSQTFRETATEFIKAQTDRNTKQDTTNQQLQIAVAQLQQQTTDINRRVEIMENRTK